MEGNDNSFGNNGVKEKIFWNRILKEIKRLISTRLREK